MVSTDDGYVVSWTANSLRAKAESAYRNTHSETKVHSSAVSKPDEDWERERCKNIILLLLVSSDTLSLPSLIFCNLPPSFPILLVSRCSPVQALVPLLTPSMLCPTMKWTRYGSCSLIMIIAMIISGCSAHCWPCCFSPHCRSTTSRYRQMGQKRDTQVNRMIDDYYRPNTCHAVIYFTVFSSNLVHFIYLRTICLWSTLNPSVFAIFSLEIAIVICTALHHCVVMLPILATLLVAKEMC